MKCVVFPGQGSQKLGMGKSLYEHSARAIRVFDEVSDAAEVNVQTLCFETSDETLRQTQNAQVALYATGLAAFYALEESGQEIGMFAGHSIGEYAALTAAGILSVADGAQLVKLRGELMAESGQAAPGGMSAVLGLDASVIAQVLSEVSGTVVVANDNCPGQVVISGEIEAIGIATPLLQAAGAKRVIALNVSGAFHSPLMADAAARLGVALKNIDFQPGKTVYSNVTAQPVADTGQWNDLLEQQLLSPVRWTESVQNLISAGVNTFIECGSGEVLSGLVKRTDKTVATHSVQDVDSLHATVEALK